MGSSIFTSMIFTQLQECAFKLFTKELYNSRGEHLKKADLCAMPTPILSYQTSIYRRHPGSKFSLEMRWAAQKTETNDDEDATMIIRHKEINAFCHRT